MQNAIFQATLVVDFDPDESTPAEALADYLVCNDVEPAFVLVTVEDAP